MTLDASYTFNKAEIKTTVNKNQAYNLHVTVSPQTNKTPNVLAYSKDFFYLFI